MKGIMFKQDLFESIVRGEKTQTRRVIVDPTIDKATKCRLIDDKYYLFYREQAVMYAVKPRYQPGEVVYLKEPYCSFGNGLWYKYGHPNADTYEWKNKMFMPARSARYFIRIAAVRVERLHAISEADAIAEGCKGVRCNHSTPYCEDCMNTGWVCDPIYQYFELWDDINRKTHPWDSNPWVWVYEFELTERLAI